jgi:hypothetical protein
MTEITIILPLFLVLSLLMAFIVIQEREITHYRKTMMAQEKVILDMVVRQINERQKEEEDDVYHDGQALFHTPDGRTFTDAREAVKHIQELWKQKEEEED